jgi:hypothetical protein
MTSKQFKADGMYDVSSSDEDELAKPILTAIRLKRKSPTSARDLSVFFPPGRGLILRSPLVKKESPSLNPMKSSGSRTVSASQPRLVPIVEIPKERPSDLSDMDIRASSTSKSSKQAPRTQQETLHAQYNKVVEGVQSVLAIYESRNEDASKGHIQWPIHYSTEDGTTKGKKCYLYCICKTEDKTIMSSEDSAQCLDPACACPGGWHHGNCLTSDERGRSTNGLSLPCSCGKSTR